MVNSLQIGRMDCYIIKQITKTVNLMVNSLQIGISWKVTLLKQIIKYDKLDGFRLFIMMVK